MTTRPLTSDIIAQSGIGFGTSGARGPAEQFTDDVCAAFTTAFVFAMRQSFTFERIAIGMDRRPSSPAMAAACTSAARAMGLGVDDYGILPTPALALQAMKHGVPCLMISGSHIPFDRNGIKFYRPDGEITKADEAAILSAKAELPSFSAPAREAFSDAANEAYAERYTRWFVDQPLKGWRVGLYQHSAAGRDLSAYILDALGADVVVLGRTDAFVPVDTEAVSADDQARGRAWTQRHGLNALLSTDGDADRPLLGDETGTWLRGDIVGLLCARALGIEALAVPISCNTAIEACGAFKKVVRTRIGSPFVLEGMASLSSTFSSVAGFEANGGFLLHTPLQKEGRTLAALPTRDALLPALTLMVEAARKGQTLSALNKALPERYTASDRLKAFPVEKSRALLEQWSDSPQKLQSALGLIEDIAAIDTTDGLRVTFTNDEIVHLRPSGNAPELRCYGEAGSAARAEQLVQQSLKALGTL
ncbi:phosphomannomutase [Halomonas sp. PAMB 3232]|uniref:phosphomannomutase n=1 Tax=Halomonas sp. PAMB 3232 TaxID=3075221 RepID=UPI002897394A|nr:phosphomannomutase [Halomonas sp. PAMB 3232]WNL40112.1 phosphomannomutase [Halomonas sp. PAMB 3232]